MALKDKFSTEQIARLKRRYEETEQSVASIAREEGLSESQLYALKRKHNWRGRKAIAPGTKKTAHEKTAGSKKAKRARPSRKSCSASSSKAAGARSWRIDA